MAGERRINARNKGWSINIAGGQSSLTTPIGRGTGWGNPTGKLLQKEAAVQREKRDEKAGGEERLVVNLGGVRDFLFERSQYKEEEARRPVILKETMVEDALKGEGERRCAGNLVMRTSGGLWTLIKRGKGSLSTRDVRNRRSLKPSRAKEGSNKSPHWKRKDAELRKAGEAKRVEDRKKGPNAVEKPSVERTRARTT